MNPLFKRYPTLEQRLPYEALGLLPTPVQSLTGLSTKLGRTGLFVKRDDLSGGIYGGNKVRKLEFLLADALRAGAKSVVTVGAAGSNHALATAIYARDLGLECTILLSDQPNARSVRDNLLMDLYAGARIRSYRTYAEQRAAIPGVIDELKKEDGVAPYLIPGGGSSALGAIGFVNAAFEIAEQVAHGEVPEPDTIHVAFGSMGTAAGLLLGLRLAGLRTRLIGVRVVPTEVGNETRFLDLLSQTAAMIQSADPTIALPVISPSDYEIRHECFGPEYGLFTPASVDAVRLARETDDLALDGTYTGKAFSAFVADAKNPKSGKTSLFWLTRNSRVYPQQALRADYHALPQSLHHYFEADVQPLDRQ